MVNTANYPDGETGAARRFTLKLRCLDDSCPLCNVAVDVPMYEELGGTFLENDDDLFCPGCGADRYTD